MGQERLNNSGLKREYVKQQLSCNLKLKNEQILQQITETLTPEKIVEDGVFCKLRFIVKFAFKKKEIIKKIPIIGQICIKVKDNILKNSKKLSQSNIIVIPDEIFKLEGNFYIYELYKILLNRVPESEGATNFLKMIALGCPKEALVYAFYKADEFDRNKEIFNIHNYQRSYKIFMIKNKLKKLPILGWGISVIKIPNTLNEMKQTNNMFLLNYQSENLALKLKIDELNHSIEQLKSRTNQLEDEIELSCNSLNNRIDKYHRELKELSIDLKSNIGQDNLYDEYKINELYKFYSERMNREIPEILKSKGILNEDSYLELAKREANKLDVNEKDKYYHYAWNIFRGTNERIKESQKRYLCFVKDAYENTGELSFADIGCGRGIFLDILKDEHIACIGVDSNSASAKKAIENNHTVYIGDAKTYINEIEKESISGISLLEVAEHLTFEYISELLNTAFEKIAKGGCIIIETINPYCYKRFGNFHIDPSHINFTSPDAYKLLLEIIGFKNIELYFYAPIGSNEISNIDICNYEGFFIVGKK